MSLFELSSAALGLAVLCCIGRGLLAWLPPGEIGSHRVADLPTTWAASYLLGNVFFAVGACVAALLRVPVSCGWITGAGALLCAARIATLPAALVPRHEVRREWPRAAARGLLALALALAVIRCASVAVDAGTGLWDVRAQAWLSQGWLVGFDGPKSSRGALDLAPLDSGAIACIAWPSGVVGTLAARVHLLAGFLAALLFAERALALARRAPLGRRIVLLLLALALVPAVSIEEGDLTLAALCALAIFGGVSWARRADRRGLALACIGWSAMALVRGDGLVLALAGLVSTLATTARPALRRAIPWVLAGILLASLWPLCAWSRGVPLLGREALESFASDWSVTDRMRVALLVGPLWVVLGAATGPALLRLLRPASDSPESAAADRPRRDLALLLCFGTLLALLAVLVTALYGGSQLLFARAWAPALLVQAAPFAAVFAGRSLVRVERTD